MDGFSAGAIFQLVQTAAILLGIPIIAFRLGRGTEALQSSIMSQGISLGASITAQGLTVNAMVNELKELKDEQKEFRSILTQVAVQNTRLDNQGVQLATLQQIVNDLRHGEGLILPLSRGAHEIR